MNIEELKEIWRVREVVPDLHLFWKGPLSQWESKHPFAIDGSIYWTAEHWMMAEKARTFHDGNTLGRILMATTPAEAKKLGREVARYDDAVWGAKRYQAVVTGNIAKFGQHEDLFRILDATGDEVLVEASPQDKIWGIGLHRDHPDAYAPLRWPGINLLGFALMDARERLRDDRRVP